MAMRPLNGCIAFKVALHAYRISTVWRELADRYHFASVQRMGERRAMAPLATYSSMGKCRPGIKILSSRFGQPHFARVAIQTLRKDGQIKRSFGHVFVIRSHVPEATLSVPIDWRFE